MEMNKSTTNHENISSPVVNTDNSLTLRFQSSFQTPKPPSEKYISPNSDNFHQSLYKEDRVGLQELRPHHTLGQMAEQFQERARAFRLRNPASDQSEEENNFQGEDESDDDHESAAHSESTGRWTKQEHELFLEALKKYGKVRFTMSHYLSTDCSFV